MKRLVIALLLAGAPLAASAQSVSGKVTDAASVPVPRVVVTVDGTQLSTQTGDDGTYRFAQVPAGSRTFVARRVGYTPQRRTVTVENSGLSVDFTLTAVSTSLDAVVTTATGTQRRIELGNTIATVDVAERMNVTAITSMGDLLKAQAPGVTINTANVMGTAPHIRIRGISSRAVSNDPIWVIDGIRMTSDVSGFGTGPTRTSAPSRLNDLNPEEIESIEIVKGPSAATLYGTDAANGVILVTTRRGKAGPPSWSFHAERGLQADENDYPDMFGIVGHAPNVANTPANARRCMTTEIFSATPACANADLVQHQLNVLEDPELTPLKPGWRTSIGGQVSGGTNNLRYFISGDRLLDDGPYGIPNFDRRRFDTTGVRIRDNMEHTNTMDRKSVRANVNAAITPTLDVSISSGLTLSDLTLPVQGNGASPWMQQYMFGYGYQQGPGYTGLSASGVRLFGYVGSTPGISSQTFLDQTTNRYIGSITASWRPRTWFVGTADVGMDLADQKDLALERAGEGTGGVVFGSTGNVVDMRVRHSNLSTNLRGTGTWNPAKSAQLRSTVGWQFVSSDHQTAIARGQGLGPARKRHSRRPCATHRHPTHPTRSSVYTSKNSSSSVIDSS